MAMTIVRDDTDNFFSRCRSEQPSAEITATFRRLPKHFAAYATGTSTNGPMQCCDGRVGTWMTAGTTMRTQDPTTIRIPN